MARRNDLSRSRTAFHRDSPLVAVVALSRSSRLVAGIVPGLARQPVKELAASAEAPGMLLRRRRDEAAVAGHTITRLAVACGPGRDGFRLARRLCARVRACARGIEACAIHPTGIAVSREHRRAETDRLDAEPLKRASPGRLRGEPGRCRMAAIPTLEEEEEEEDAGRPSRGREKLVGARTRIVNRLEGNPAPACGHP